MHNLKKVKSFGYESDREPHKLTKSKYKNFIVRHYFIHNDVIEIKNSMNYLIIISKYENQYKELKIKKSLIDDELFELIFNDYSNARDYFEENTSIQNYVFKTSFDESYYIKKRYRNGIEAKEYCYLKIDEDYEEARKLIQNLIINSEGKIDEEYNDLFNINSDDSLFIRIGNTQIRYDLNLRKFVTEAKEIKNSKKIVKRR